MKKKDNEVRKKWVLVRMNQAEYDAFYSFYKQTTCRCVSEYFRKVVLKKTVTFKYRSESADEILAAFLKMQNQLNTVGNYLNNAVHELHMLDRIPDFRNWTIKYQNLPVAIVNKLQEIYTEMNQIYDQYI
jgi:hypothetical protein